MQNVLLIKGRSQYNALRNYIDEIEIGFRLAGYNTHVLDATEESCMFQYEELIHNVQIDLLFVCNAILSHFLPEAHYLTYLTDHPANHKERLAALDARACVFVCDRNHEAYLKRYCPNIKHVKYIPLSGEAAESRIPYESRSLGIVFTGGYIKPEKIYEAIFSCDETLHELAKHTAAAIIEDPKKDLEKGLRESLAFFGKELSDSSFHETMFQLMAIDGYVRSYYRDRVIRSLVENGLQVHVFGNGWEEFEGIGKEHLILETGNDYIARKAVANAKISLNIMPWFKDGFQERIAAAMLSGTVALTDESIYINENFTDGEELVLYSLEHLNELPAKVKWLLEHPDEAAQIANAGKRRAQKELTWQHRTFEMIRYAEKCFDLRTAPKGMRGEILPISYQSLHNRNMRSDAIHSINDILDAISQVRAYGEIDLSDVDYYYTKFLFAFVRFQANFPEVNLSEVVQQCLSGLQEEQANQGAELLILECMHLLAIFLSMENHELNQDKGQLQAQLSALDRRPNQFAWRLLIEKLKSNYQDSNDDCIQEILRNIEANQYVSPYNQNFVQEFASRMDGYLDLVHYDPDAGMPYALWNGKRMYYPKEYSTDFAATAFRFTSLEQYPQSPHRYLSPLFDVEEGDIVVDAGVAEGNFALDVVERAKKVYLVECEHKWVEALHKTFEPWKDKVVIVEKLLGETENESCTALDSLVEEGYVNFLKLDVEGAEIPSLKGASKLLANRNHMKCAICAYHRKNAEQEIRELLEGYDFYTTTTKGYLFFKEDVESWIDGELRHGVVRAIKSGIS